MIYILKIILLIFFMCLSFILGALFFLPHFSPVAFRKGCKYLDKLTNYSKLFNF